MFHMVKKIFVILMLVVLLVSVSLGGYLEQSRSEGNVSENVSAKHDKRYTVI